MTHRSRRHKKRFACGHRGFGQYCHHCANQQGQKRAKPDHKKREKPQCDNAFADDVIDLRGLPTHIIGKARQVLAKLSQGTHYWELSGKRLHMIREVVRIPITRRYRLLCHHDGTTVKPLKVMSHEEYNPLFRNPNRLLVKLFSRDKSKR